MVDDRVYFSVQAWMVTKLGLRGCERDVFAIVYGYSQDGESDYHGSLGYIAELTGYSKNSICTALKSLTDKQLIVKTEQEINNIKFCRYQINRDSIQATCMGVQATCINNKQDNNTNNKKVVSKDTTTEFEFGKSKPKKESLYTKCVTLIDSYDFSNKGNIRKLLIEYLQFRLSVRDKSLYVNMWKGMLNKLNEMCGKNVAMCEAIIKQSIERGYLSFYPISSGSNNASLSSKPWERGVRSDRYTEEELEELAELDRQREAQGLRTRF